MGGSIKGGMGIVLRAPRTAEGCSERTLRLTQPGGRKGGLTADEEVPEPGTGTSSDPGARQSARPSAAGTTAQPRPKAYRKAGPGQAAPRRRRDGAGAATDTKKSPSIEPRTRMQRLRHHFPHPGTSETSTPEVYPAEKEGESLIGAGRRGKVSPEGVSRTGRGGASVARRLT